MKEELQRLGLTEGEARVYLALLKLGTSTVGPISKLSKVTYSKVYDVLERLIEKGIVTFIVKNKTKHFQALEPNRLKEILDRKEKEIQQDREMLDKLLIRLNKVKDKSGKSYAEIFLGKEGLKTAYDVLMEDFSKNDTLCFFYIFREEFGDLVKDFYNQKFKDFNKVGIKMKGIVTDEFAKSEYYNPPKSMEVRIANFPIPTTLNIYQDKVLIISWSEKPFSVLIKSADIANDVQDYFNQSWEKARK